jgi:hypothetical protein
VLEPQARAAHADARDTTKSSEKRAMLLRTSLAAAAAACVLLCAPAAHADTTDVSGIKYENELKLANSRLVLNGAGTRYKAIFKVYTAGLYLPAKTSAPEAV